MFICLNCQLDRRHVEIDILSSSLNQYQARYTIMNINQPESALIFSNAFLVRFVCHACKQHNTWPYFCSSLQLLCYFFLPGSALPVTKNKYVSIKDITWQLQYALLTFNLNTLKYRIEKSQFETISIAVKKTLTLK